MFMVFIENVFMRPGMGIAEAIKAGSPAMKCGVKAISVLRCAN